LNQKIQELKSTITQKDNEFEHFHKKIEETDKEIVLRSEIAKSLRKKLKEDLENKMKKLCSPCY